MESIRQLSFDLGIDVSDARPCQLRLTAFLGCRSQAPLFFGPPADGVRGQRFLEHGRQPRRR